MGIKLIKSNNVYHIDRIVFNFMDRCNMVCDFCYVPFDENGIGDLKLWLKIINKCKEWNPRRITFEGGDPFKIRKFPCLLKKLSLEDLFLQVDTNCLGLREHHLSIIKSAVKLISVPLEGPKSIHTKMRNNSYHFDLIINWINKFTKNKIGIKVNTVVTKLNINYLDELAKTLRKYSIKAWSLYQFWPIGPAKDNQKKIYL